MKRLLVLSVIGLAIPISAVSAPKDFDQAFPKMVRASGCLVDLKLEYFKKKSVKRYVTDASKFADIKTFLFDNFAKKKGSSNMYSLCLKKYHVDKSMLENGKVKEVKGILGFGMSFNSKMIQSFSYKVNKKFIWTCAVKARRSKIVCLRSKPVANLVAAPVVDPKPPAKKGSVLNPLQATAPKACL